MLPEHHYVDDAEWIAEQLSRLPVAYIPKAVREYSKVYVESYENEKAPVRKEHMARNTANTRLRHYIDRVLAHIASL